MLSISIIIPAYNEEQRIGKTLNKIIDYLNKNRHNYEIIVIDDGSTDDTIKVIKNIGNNKIKILQNKTNRGKGYSIKKGILCAKYPLVLFSDSDLSTPIEELKKFIDYINEGYDIVIASRNLKDSNIIVRQPFYRQMMGKFFPLLVNVIALQEFRDTQCGFKLFKKNVAQNIFQLQTLERFSFDVEILFIAKKMGYKIKEAPVIWIDQKESKVRIIKDSIKMLTDLLKIRYNDFLGKYEIKSK